MITAVAVVLAGEAALFGSVGVLIWCAVFFALNWAFFVLYEEPGLARRSGEQYAAYRANVTRWIPRRRAWTAGENDPRSRRLSAQKREAPAVRLGSA